MSDLVKYAQAHLDIITADAVVAQARAAAESVKGLVITDPETAAMVPDFIKQCRDGEKRAKALLVVACEKPKAAIAEVERVVKPIIADLAEAQKSGNQANTAWLLSQERKLRDAEAAARKAAEEAEDNRRLLGASADLLEDGPPMDADLILAQESVARSSGRPMVRGGQASSSLTKKLVVEMMSESAVREFDPFLLLTNLIAPAALAAFEYHRSRMVTQQGNAHTEKDPAPVDAKQDGEAWLWHGMRFYYKVGSVTR